MTSKLIWTPLALAALLAAQGALAQPASGGITREQVKKECAEARKAGKILVGECEPDPPAGKSTSTTTREEVKKEALAARKAGKIQSGECAYETPDKIKSGKTRAEVMAECARARKAGEIPNGEVTRP
jgi:hypothetical protein